MNTQISKNIFLKTNKTTYLPKYIAQYSIVAYLVSISIVSILYINQIFPFWLWLFGIGSILLFFLGSNYFTKMWHNISSATFVNKLLLSAFLIRLVYVIFIYYFNWNHYGTYYESSDGDITFYVPAALQIVEQLSSGSFSEVIQTWLSWGVDVSDMGYIIYLSIVYLITGGISDVVIPLILKSLYGAITCVFIYRIAQRHFGEHVARMTGIFCMLHFTLIWWCGSMMKETEMIFLVTWYVNIADKVLSQEYFKLKDLIGAIILCGCIFTFRAALSLVGFLALFVAIILSDSKAIKLSNKIIIGLLVAIVFVVAYSGGLSNIIEDAQIAITDTSGQQANMEMRAARAEGNRFAKYAGAAVFAPMIFTIPFPTMAYTFMDQEHIMMNSGGYFIKNVLSFFVIWVMFMLLFSGKWRKHVFPIAMLCGYLLALVFSNFAQSGRFHMPIIPLFMMFAAYGISFLNIKQISKWYNYALILEIFICVAWAWFKLAGRGLI